MMRGWKGVLAVLTRDGNLHLFDPSAGDDVATHPEVLRAINEWSASRPSTTVAASAAHVKGGAPAAAAAATAAHMAAAAAETAAPSAHILPPPPLPPAVMAVATNVADMLAVEDVADAPLARAKKAGAAPPQTFPITATTKLAFAPAAHADAFDISDRTGLFGFTTKLTFRAASPDDCVDWVVAANAVIDMVVLAASVEV